MTDCPNNCEHYNECNCTDRYDYTNDGIIDYKTNKKYKSYEEIVKILNKKEDEFNKCEKCYHFNELIHWDEGLFYQCKQGHKLWKKCDDYEVIE